jgi:hypothetical protein
LNLDIRLRANNEIPAFAGYVNHSGTDGAPEIVVNFRASLLCSAEHGGDYKAFFAENVVHEMLHMVQDIFGQAFSEDEVEDAILSARDYLKNESTKAIGQTNPPPESKE